MDQDRGRRARAVLAGVARHRWISLGVVLVVVILVMTVVPLSRTNSVAFDLTSGSSPQYLASVCLPSDPKVKMSWSATDPLPEFQITVLAPDGTTDTLGGTAVSIQFDSIGGAYYFSAQNLSLPAGSVHVDLSWSHHGSFYQLYIAPQPPCSAL